MVWQFFLRNMDQDAVTGGMPACAVELDAAGFNVVDTTLADAEALVAQQPPQLCGTTIVPIV